MKLSLFVIFSIFSFNISASSNQWQGQPFAQFKLADQNGKIRTNKDFAGHWMIAYFYPKDKTPGCTVEAQKFVNDYTGFKLLNTEIVGISYDDAASHKDFAETYEMEFTLLADVDHKLSKAMDVDRFLPWPHSSRQTFIVNDQGIIMKHYENVDPKTHSKQLLADLKLLMAK